MNTDLDIASELYQAFELKRYVASITLAGFPAIILAG